MGAPESGGKLEMTQENCNITDFSEYPQNSSVCRSPGDAKEGCELLIQQLNNVQKGKDKEKDKGWAFNLCGACGCDWSKAKWFKPGDGELKLTFDKTWIGQQIEIGFLGQSSVDTRLQVVSQFL